MSDIPNVIGIVREYLTTNGYDGLCSNDCGCGVNDLVPCCEDCSVCAPAYRWECKHCIEKCDEEPMYGGENGGCYQTEKQEKPND